MSTQVFSCDVLRNISSYLPGFPALVACSLVDHQWKCASDQSEKLWRSHLLLSYGEELETVLHAFSSTTDEGQGHTHTHTRRVSPCALLRKLQCARYTPMSMDDSDGEEAQETGSTNSTQNLEDLQTQLRQTFMLSQLRSKGKLLAHRAFSLADSWLSGRFFRDDPLELTSSKGLGRESMEDRRLWTQTLYLVEGGGQGGCRVAKVTEMQCVLVYYQGGPFGTVARHGCGGQDRFYRPIPGPRGKVYQNELQIHVSHVPSDIRGRKRTVTPLKFHMSFKVWIIHATWGK